MTVFEVPYKPLTATVHSNMCLEREASGSSIRLLESYIVEPYTFVYTVVYVHLLPCVSCRLCVLVSCTTCLKKVLEFE